MRDRHRSQLEREGFTTIPSVADPEVQVLLRNALDGVDAQDSKSVRRRESIYGIRNLLEMVPTVWDWANSNAARALVTPIIGTSAFPVRGILFDKTPAANWNVVWHQDLSIAVEERREVLGFGAWSVKAGVLHVQPPDEILARMLTLRLHLDDCDEENGPLRVIPGSHRHGRLDAAAIQAWRQQHQEVLCPVPAGGVLLMRPLLLHASSDARSPRHRRVIHLDFAAEPLPDGLRWRAQSQGIET